LSFVSSSPDSAQVRRFDGGGQTSFVPATSWNQVAELEGSDTAANDDFGCSVAISGSTAVVGADGQNGRQCRPSDRG
jgi:hypothetical protein